jgi:hypothetical protein
MKKRDPSPSRILITSCNSAYFRSCVTLIASIHRTSMDIVSRIIVYDLGLRWRERCFLNALRKVTVVDYPPALNQFYEGYLEPRQFAWKCFALQDARKYGPYVLYLDSGAMALKNIKVIYDIIEKEDIFLVRDKWKNFQWTTSRHFEIMQASEKEKNDFQLYAGILGYKAGGRYQKLIDEAFEYSKIKDCIFGEAVIRDPAMPRLLGHRHDQSIYSVLASRYDCPRQDIGIFGEWRGILSDKQVIYVHRCKYSRKDGLRMKLIPLFLSEACVRFALVCRQKKTIREAHKKIKAWFYRNNLTKLGMICGTDKWDRWHTYRGLSYLDLYEKYFKDFKKKPINILEIGVLNGASLRMLKQYFPEAKIYGLDIDPEAKQHEEDRISIEIGNQTDTEVLNRLSDRAKDFDIIIDDGSHVNKHIIKSFEHLFPKLKKRGIYIIEDLGCSYSKLEEISCGDARKGVREIWPGMNYNDPSEDLNNNREDMDLFFENIIHDLDNRRSDILSIHFWSCMAVITKA